MKCTWPMPAPRVGDPTPPISHLLTLGVGIGGNTNFSVRIGGNANFSVVRYQHVGISKAKLWHWGSTPTRGDMLNEISMFKKYVEKMHFLLILTVFLKTNNVFVTWII